MLARNGIPILIEKPVGIGSEPQQNWEELVQLSSKVPIAVGYVLRHDPCADYIKDKLVKQELGKVLEADFYCGSWLPDWRSPSDYRKCVTSQRSLGGGALLEISHEIDMALWFLDDFQIVFALLGHSNLLEVDVEDQVLLVGCVIIVLKLLYALISALAHHVVVWYCVAKKERLIGISMKGKFSCLLLVTSYILLALLLRPTTDIVSKLSALLSVYAGKSLLIVHFRMA